MGFLLFLVIVVVAFILYCCRRKSKISSQYNITTTYALSTEYLMNLTDGDFEQFITDALTSYFQNSANTPLDIQQCIQKRLDYINNQLELTRANKKVTKARLSDELRNLQVFIQKCRRHKSRKHFRSKLCDNVLLGIELALFHNQPLMFFRFTIDSEPYFEVFYNFVYSDKVYASLSEQKKAELYLLMQNLSIAYCDLVECIQAENQLAEKEDRLVEFQHSIQPMLDAYSSNA